jgi:hypothetical protein
MTVDYPTVDEVRVAIKQRAHGKLNGWLAELELPSSVKEHRAWEMIQEYGKTITAEDVSQGNEQLTLLCQ